MDAKDSHRRHSMMEVEYILSSNYKTFLGRSFKEVKNKRFFCFEKVFVSIIALTMNVWT